MKKQKGLSLIAVLLIIGALALAAGGVMVWEKRVSPTPTTSPVVTVEGPVVPGLSEDAKDLPTAAPTFITPFPEDSSKVQILLSKTTYQRDEKIFVSIKNTGNHQLGYYNCPGPKGGVVWFERKVGQTWKEEISLAGPDYGSKRPCYPRFLEARGKLKVSRTVSAEVPTGTYRAVFWYIDGKVYSDEFTIVQPPSAQKCGIYYRNGREETHCVTCGNSICEPFEGCTPSSCTSGACTRDCGPLYCRKDCE